MTRSGVRVFYSQSPIKGVHGRFFAPFNGPNKNRCFYGDFGEIRHANRAMAIAKSSRYKICVVSCFENYAKFRFGFLALAFNCSRELRFAQYTVVKLCISPLQRRIGQILIRRCHYRIAPRARQGQFAIYSSRGPAVCQLCQTLSTHVEGPARS